MRNKQWKKKCIIKVIRSFENRETLLKGTTKNVTSQEGGFLNFLRVLTTAGLPLMKNVLTPLAKSVLTSSRLVASESATDFAIQKKKKKKFVSGTTALIIWKEKMEDIIKIAKLLEETGLLIKGVSETVTNETKEAYWKVYWEVR